MIEGKVSYMPTDALSYRPSENIYWDADALKTEITRVFEICHGCRLCFKYCDSFPSLFKFIDDDHQGDTRKLTSSQVKKVMDDCFECKLCEINCPYTPRDKHEFKLDFPKLVHRYKAVLFKQNTKSLQNKLLGSPDLSSKLARISMGMANIMNTFRPHRILLEKLFGIHRDKKLPHFAKTTFEKWAKKSLKIKESENIEAVLFQTCYIQNNEPQIGKDTLSVFEKNKINITCEKGFVCCGMPAWEQGDLKTLRKNAKHNISILLPYVKKGAKIITINPTCAMMMRLEYQFLVEKEDLSSAIEVSKSINDPCEFLWKIRNEKRFNTNFLSSPGKISYHAPCHLRAQAIGLKGRDILKKIPDVQISTTMECSGHDGTYAMKKENFKNSIRIGKKAFNSMKATKAKVWASECPLAGIQFDQHTGVRPMHPISILRNSYLKNGFN